MTDQVIDTEPTVDRSGLVRQSGLHGAVAAAPLALRFVFPVLRARPIFACADGAPLVLGREGDGDGCLEGSELSRRHAELRFAGGRLLLRDLGSRNGVFVNGVRHAQVVLQRHDVVRLGSWIGVVLDARQPVDEAPLGPVPGLHLGPSVRRLMQPAQIIAPTGIAVVLEGETGTGKERVARAIHTWSGRKGPLCAINCAAVPEALAEAELFGHREGAFTGAQGARPGHFRAADGGTLFLDEVTDLPMSVQGKLLRALEEKAVTPVGESQPVPVDVRFIAATQVPLEHAVAAGRLRSDLRARLEGYLLRLPPLRERRDDIPSLFLHLLGKHGLAAPVLSPRLVEALLVYPWPLNVRELDFLAQRLVALHGKEPALRHGHLPPRFTTTPDVASEDLPPLPRPPAGAVARADLLAALSASAGNLARAARRLGITRQRAYRLLGDDSRTRLASLRGRPG